MAVEQKLLKVAVRGILQILRQQPLRYEMYVQTLQWFKREDYPEGVVRDKFDDYSHSYVAINNQGEIEGCIRVNPDGTDG